MKKYKIFKRVEHEKIICVCLQSNKKCKRFCEKDSMYYDQYKGLEECFRNNREVRLK